MHYILETDTGRVVSEFQWNADTCDIFTCTIDSDKALKIDRLWEAVALQTVINTLTKSTRYKAVTVEDGPHSHTHTETTETIETKKPTYRLYLILEGAQTEKLFVGYATDWSFDHSAGSFHCICVNNNNVAFARGVIGVIAIPKDPLS